MPSASRPRTLDPRFADILDAAEDAGWLPRAVAREQAEAIARAAGMTFVEALREIGRLPLLPGSQPPCEVSKSPAHAHLATDAHLSTNPIRGLSDARAAQILAALAADPSRSDRAVARQCRCSPTLVGRARAAAGLASGKREVRRGGKAYEMALPASGASTP